MAGQRRRGEELEAALLQAAWDELTEAGFTKLTMESVAARARTGVAVLYRRWANKDDLVLAAIRHYGRTHPVDIPDTGSLRDDMLALLTSASEQRHAFTSVITATFAGLLAGSGLTPEEVRARLLGDRPLWSHEIFRRAHDRGEIDLDTIPPPVLSMPFDLLRHDVLMTLKPVPKERIESIVDDLFLPLVNAQRQECTLPCVLEYAMLSRGRGTVRRLGTSRLIAAATAVAVIVTAAVVITGKTTAARKTAAGSQWATVWSDDFSGPASGSLNPEYWRFDTGPGASFGTGEVERMTSSAANVRLSSRDGLTITALGRGAANGPGTQWTSGRIRTRRLFTPPSGRQMMVTASIRQPDPAVGTGYWPAFWMLGQDSASWPADGEIDILEDINGLGRHSGALHCGNLKDKRPDGTFGPCHEPNGIGSGSLSCPDCRQEFHNYSVIIDRRNEARQQIRWYLDGREFFHVSEPAVGQATWTHAIDHGFWILLDLAIGGSYPDAVCGCASPTARTTSGALMAVRHVGVYITKNRRQA